MYLKTKNNYLILDIFNEQVLELLFKIKRSTVKHWRYYSIFALLPLSVSQANQT